MNTYFLEQLLAPTSVSSTLDSTTTPALHTLAPCVLTIGNFDGVHLGHQAMLDQVRALADERNLAQR